MEMVLFFIIFIVFVIFSVPVSFAMLICSFGFLYLSGSPILILPERITSGLNSYPLLAMPLFIIAARIMNSAGITKRIFDLCIVFIGHKKAGLAHVNVLASMIFAGISGSAMADVAGLGAIEMKAMTDEGYDPTYTAAITAASCTIGPVIPPSMIMILIGVMTEVSIGRLFVAGFIPGVLMGLSLIVFISIQSRLDNHYFPSVRKARSTHAEYKTALKRGALPMLAPIIILGTILSGIATPTEAGIIAVLYAFFLGFLYKELNAKNIFYVLKDAAIQTGVIMFIVAAAQIFSWIITTEQVAVMAYNFIQQFVTSTWVMLLIMNIFLLFIGCFIEGLAAIMITIPILLPVAVQMGVSPIQFGVMLCINILLGLLTPPLGLSVYIAADVVKVNPIDVFKKTIPFLIPLVIILLLVTYVPEIVMFLPNMIFTN